MSETRAERQKKPAARRKAMESRRDATNDATPDEEQPWATKEIGNRKARAAGPYGRSA